jgi:hypothetical protein
MKRIFLKNSNEKCECLIIIPSISLLFFSIKILDYEKSGGRFGEDNYENEDEGSAFDIDETDLDLYSTVFEDSDEF